MANVIAVIWDCDQTLVDGYMQDPIFRYYKVDAKAFWREVNALPALYYKDQGIRVNPETIYLNHFIHYAKSGKFQGLNNSMLYEFGKEMKFYPGVPDIFPKLTKLIEENPTYQDHDIKLEHYVISTGMKAIINGSAIVPYVDGIWGCELIEDDCNGERIICETGFTLDNTTKTRAIFEINKGVVKHPEIDVNAKVPEEKRRVRFENMIYIADGPSDIPAFSLIHKNGGATFAVYPRGNDAAFKQVDQLRMDGRIDMYGEADYREDTTTYMWLKRKITEKADRIVEREKQDLADAISETPKHLDH